MCGLMVLLVDCRNGKRGEAAFLKPKSRSFIVYLITCEWSPPIHTHRQKESSEVSATVFHVCYQRAVAKYRKVMLTNYRELPNRDRDKLSKKTSEKMKGSQKVPKRISLCC